MAAEAEQGGERTEDPSQKRLQDARERGQVPRSRELTNFATMIGGSAVLAASCQSAITSKSAIQPLWRPVLGIKPPPRNSTSRVSDAESVFGRSSDAARSSMLDLALGIDRLLAN